MRIGLLLFLLTWPLLSYGHDKSDVVTMYNGDKITGEILGLTRGDLKINPRYASPIELEWRFVAHVESNYNFEILTENDERLYGNISKTGLNGELQFTSIEDAKVLPLLTITEMRPVEESIADRLQYTLGANLTFEPDLRTYKIEGSVTYASPRGQTSLRANFLESTTRTLTQTDNGREEYIDGEPQISTFARIEHQRWTDRTELYRTFNATVDYNDQLNNFGRVSLGSGIGRYFIDQSGMRLSSSIGLQGIAERSKAGEINQSFRPFSTCNLPEDTSDGDCTVTEFDWETLYSAEAFGSASLVMYSLTDLDMDLTLEAALYPSLTEDDRIRAHVEAALSWEVVSDLFVKLSFLSDFDSGDRDQRILEPYSTKRLDYNLLFGLDWRP